MPLAPRSPCSSCKSMEETTNAVYERIRDPTWLSGKGEGEGQWSSGLCDCFSDCRKCIISIIPVVNTFDVAHTYNVMDNKEGITGEVCAPLHRRWLACGGAPSPPAARRDAPPFGPHACPRESFLPRDQRLHRTVHRQPCCGIVLPVATICSGTCALLSCVQVRTLKLIGALTSHPKPYSLRCCPCVDAPRTPQIFVVRSKFHDPPYNIKPTFSFCPLAVEDFCCALFCGWW